MKTSERAVWLAVAQYAGLVALTVVCGVACPLWASLPMGALWSLAIVSDVEQLSR